LGDLLLGCSGWNYPDTADKGGWTGVFYLTRTPKGFAITQFFNTAEMDSTFTRNLFPYDEGHIYRHEQNNPREIPIFQKSETVTHVKRLDVKKEP
jgi:hypothetical protein